MGTFVRGILLELGLRLSGPRNEARDGLVPAPAKLFAKLEGRDRGSFDCENDLPELDRYELGLCNDDGLPS